MTYQRTLKFELTEAQKAEMGKLLSLAMSERGVEFKTARQQKDASPSRDETRAGLLEKITARAAESSAPAMRAQFDAYEADASIVAAFAIADTLQLSWDAGCSPLQVFQAAALYFNMRLGRNSEFGPVAELIDDVLDIAADVEQGMKLPDAPKDAETKIEVDPRLARHERQMEKVRLAYWSEANTDDSAWTAMDGLLWECGIEKPTPQQLKAVFMMLDEREFCAGLEWGFHDTVVRDNLYSWLRDEKDKILEAVKGL
jgi:hypothetical protein